jgi:hypothetical protein
VVVVPAPEFVVVVVPPPPLGLVVVVVPPPLGLVVVVVSGRLVVVVPPLPELAFFVTTTDHVPHVSVDTPFTCPGAVSL